VRGDQDFLPFMMKDKQLNPLNAEINPICHLLALVGAHHILRVSGVRVKQENKIWCTTLNKRPPVSTLIPPDDSSLLFR
jgi:hypothetical protein